MNEEQMMAELLQAAHATGNKARPCQVCESLEAMSKVAADVVRGYLTGTIGRKTLAAVLTRNGYPTGERAIRRHQLEGHTP